MRILASNPDSLGDLILRQPLYSALISAGHELMLAVRASYVDIASDIAPGAQLVAIDIDPYLLALNPDWDALIPLLNSARDFAADTFLVAPYQWTLLEEWLGRHLSTARVFGLTGHLYPGDAGWGVRPQSTLRFDTQVAISEDAPELAKNQALAAMLLDRQVQLDEPRLTVSGESIAIAQAELGRLGLAEHDYWVACVGHGEAKAVRNWSQENWCNVLSYWADKYGPRFLLMGSDEERQTTESVRQGLTGRAAETAVTLSGNRSMHSLAALIHLSRGYVGRDTGPMHLAAALGKPVVAVFGGGTWPRFQPAATPSWIAMVDVPCAGCDWKCPFDQSYCIKEVPADEVRGAIDALEAGHLTGRVVRELEPSSALSRVMLKQAPANQRTRLGNFAVANRNELARRELDLRGEMAFREKQLRDELAVREQERIDHLAQGHRLVQDQLSAQLQEARASLLGLKSQLALDRNRLAIAGMELTRRRELLAASHAEMSASQAALAEKSAELLRVRGYLTSEQAVSQQRLGAMRGLESRMKQASALLSRLVESEKSDSQATEAHIQSLMETNRTLDDRVRLLMTSRLMRAGWKIGLGKTPQWPDMLIHTPDSAARVSAATESKWAELQKLLSSGAGAALPVAASPALFAPEDLAPAARAHNRRPWPYAPSQQAPLPGTLPGGKPWPKISIVTPSFNQGQYIEQTILSVLNQAYPNLEYIVMDGGSTDATVSILDRYRNRITRVVSEKDKGQSNAINKGFALSTGELMTWLNSDDMLEPGALAAMAMAFHTSGADMVAGICTLHCEGKITTRHMTSCGDGPLPLDDLLDIDNCWMKGQFFYQPEVMFTRDLWRRAGSHVDESLYFSMDYELWLRFAEQKAVLHPIGRSICLFRVHDAQKTRDVDGFQPELLRVRDRFLQNSGRLPRRRLVSTPKTSLRVLFFNDLGPLHGAGIAHDRLAQAMGLAGHEIVPLAIHPNLFQWQRGNDPILSAIAERNPDLVVMGNLHAAGLEASLLGDIAKRWPTIQVLHDFHTLTGRCPYPGDCSMYLRGCDHTCPTAHEYPVLEPRLIRPAWEAKRDALTSDAPPVLAANSAWTAGVIRHRLSEGWQGRTPPVIELRLGVPQDVFKPRDKSMCRDFLGLPQDRYVILFSSSQLADQRKGLTHLVEALRSLNLPDLLAVCVGHFSANGAVTDLQTRNMGYFADPHMLAMLYSAADLYVGPSTVETFGQVFVEAAACGTPSVGYATAGGVGEAVADGVSGRLAPTVDSSGLAAAIAELHGDPSLSRDMGEWATLWTENEYSLPAAYQRLFSQLNQTGLISRLGLPPKVAFMHTSVSLPPTVYLEPVAPQPTEALPADGNGAYAQLRSRLGSVEAERDGLRTAVNNITQTRLWRMVAATYPTYQRIVHKSYLPGFVRRSIQATGDWLADRSNTQT